MSTPTQPPPRVTLLGDLISEFAADTRAAAEARASGRPRGPVTGLPRLDETLGTYLAPGIHLLQAAPGAGKTAFALQAAARCQFPAIFVTAEMPTLELFRRLIARETGTFLGKLKTGELGEKEATRLALLTAEKLPTLALMDATRGYASPTAIYEAAKGLRERMRAEHMLIAIDSIQCWAKSARGDNAGLAGASEYDLINAALLAAGGLAAEIGCPVLVVSHRNRQGQKDGGLHAAKGSGDLEYMAETVIDLDRKKDERPDAAGEVEVTASIVKNRNGVPGVSVPLRFCGRVQEFREGR